MLIHPRLALLGFWLTLALAASASASSGTRRVSVAILDFGAAETGPRAAARLWTALAADTKFSMMNRDLSGAAARGASYAGSLNMTREEARDLGAAIGSDFFITGNSETLRRSPSTGSIYYEAYASVFIVSARSGKLVMWDHIVSTATTTVEAEARIFLELDGRAARYSHALNRSQEEESKERAAALVREVTVIEPLLEEASEEDDADQKGFRPPLPFRRLRPVYPATAARAEAEATVDVMVEIHADGEVGHVEVVRWAGFGLDEATVATVRQMQFRPAERDGVPVPLRALLRYNFRRPKGKG
ncbi:MAG: TonB family protein [Pyrinomonadaceae bacterium]|nr:TonB family protein [Pyrinomonadaceae bacterium]